MGIVKAVRIVEYKCFVYLRCGSSVVILGASTVYEVHYVYRYVPW